MKPDKVITKGGDVIHVNPWADINRQLQDMIERMNKLGYTTTTKKTKS